jgi:hypothetical protein
LAPFENDNNFLPEWWGRNDIELPSAVVFFFTFPSALIEGQRYGWGFKW